VRLSDESRERLILLTDGVYAISLTLLALEIRLPARWRGEWQSLAYELALPLSAYFFSFFVLAVSWAQHRQQFEFLRCVDQTATALHLATLAFVALTPAAISILLANSEFPGIAAYLACVVLLRLLEAAFWGYVGLVRDYIDPSVTRIFRWWTLVSKVAVIVAVSAIVIGVAPARGGKVDVANIPIWSWAIFVGGVAMRFLALRRIKANAISQS
jgi:uncharacterized membrane protein